MTDQPTTPKRWRPRFSVRTLVILVTLVCCYVACWGPTKTWGVRDVEEYDSRLLRLFGSRVDEAWESPIVPLIISSEDNGNSNLTTRRYYFWFFGYVAKLPYERDVP